MAMMQRYKELHPGQLRAFCACVQHKSYSAAARALEVSQPVVWQQVRALERDFGARLLERRGRELELTDDGRTFFELASSLVSGMESLQELFQERRRVRPHPVVVAGSVALFNQELAPLVVAFCQQYPEVPLSLLTYHNVEIEERLAAGQGEIGVTPHGSLPARHPLLVSEVLCQRRWHLVAPAGHPLARKRRLRVADLVSYPLILANPQANDWSRTVMAALARAGVLDQLRLAVQIDDSMTACTFVSLGLGLTITPHRPLGAGGVRLCMRPLDELFSADYLVVQWRRGASPRPQAQLFIDFLRQKLSTAR
jgi:DNA-binding transcriptional LysR family regulator